MTVQVLRNALFTTATVVALGLGASTASAQVVVRPVAIRPVAVPVVRPPAATTNIIVTKQLPSTYYNVNPNPYVATGLKLNQWAYNTTVVGKTYTQFPPWYYGYNPYPVVANYGPVYRTPPIYNPYPTYPGYNPYPIYPGYSPLYSPYYSPYVDPYAGYSPYGP